MTHLNQYLLRRFFAPALIFASLLSPALEAKTKPQRTNAQPAASQQQKAATETWRRTELFFGCSKPDGSTISEKQFQQFVSAEITPRFPSGLTVMPSRGQYLDSTGTIIKERSMQIILFYPANLRDANRKIEEIRAAYKQSFQQESVLRVDTLALVSF
ncbi:MAG: DUF3574 domain-containing protein [Acidobacteria bacterium]|nr:DUF3574 domain-containing protein [Acidobacteriota bacterium]